MVTKRCGAETTQTKAGTYEDLVQEVLHKLFLQRPRGEEPMQISSKEFSHEITRKKGPILLRYIRAEEADATTHISS